MTAALWTTLLVAATIVQPGHVVSSRFSWVGLFNDDLLQWLENENRLPTLCPEADDPARHAECVAERLDPRVVAVAARYSPHVDAPLAGQLVIVAMPGRGLRTYAVAGRSSIAFTPDLHDTDWGYGPWRHQTVIEARETWVRLPVPPLGPVWLDTRDWTTRPAIHTLSQGDIVSTPKGDMVVLDVEHASVRVRPEQPADHWCADGDPPPLSPADAIDLSLADVVDSERHLRLTVKYMRGC